MMRERRLFMVVIVAAALAALGAPRPATAQEVWSGRTFFFEKGDFANPDLEANQDRITDNVWITRDDLRGIYNIAQETGYTTNVSPVDTEWATGDAVDYATLTFQPWQLWHGSNPPGTVGVDACVHLITDDIYIDIRFESWTTSAGGGGFSYYRGREDTPVERGTWSTIKALYEN